MTEEKFRSLSKYSRVASWAIWNESNAEDTLVIRRNIDILHNEVVLVGLNVSRCIDSDWGNFHDNTHARKLMKLFNGNSYQGAYMTDLIKDHVAVSSKSLDDLDQTTIDKNVKAFKDEMTLLDADNSTLFILFGQRTQELFINELVFFFNNIATCTHYSYYGKGFTDEEWVEKTASKLKKHYQKTNKVFNTKKFYLI